MWCSEARAMENVVFERQINGGWGVGGGGGGTLVL